MELRDIIIIRENGKMDRQTAADLLDNLLGMVDDSQGSDYDTALKMGIKALNANLHTILTEDDFMELRDRFGEYVEGTVRDMASGEGKRWHND